MVNHTILQGVKSILQGVKSMPPARFCAAGPALINRKLHKTPPPFPQPKQECKPRFICHKALNFPSTIFQSNFSTPTPGQYALSAPHLLQPVLSQRLKRNENPSQHLLHPISALLFDEKHKLCPVPSIIHPSSKIPPETKTLLTTISTPARRWAACSHSLCRPIFFIFVLTAPGSFLRSLPSLAFRPRGIEKLNLCSAPSATYLNTKTSPETRNPPRTLYRPSLFKCQTRNVHSSQYLLHPVQALPPDEKREICLAQFTPKVARRWHVAREILFHFSLMRNEKYIPLSGVYREGRSPCRTLKGGQGGTIVGSPRFFRFLSSEKGRIKKANFVLVQTHLETSSLLSTFLKNILL